MGLSDIDEDEPPPPRAVTAVATTGTTATQSAARVNLDDLFGTATAAAAHNGDDSRHATAALPPPPPTTTTTMAGAPDVLDSLFAAPAAESTSLAARAPATPLTAGGDAPVLYVDDTTPMACVASSAARCVDGSCQPYPAAAGAGAAAVPATNLLDLSQPTQRQRHESAESLLEAFEQRGKRRGYDDANSLSNLTRNKDDNKVKARLLALMNYYDVLGVAPTATTAEIRQSYKRKALALHPDKAGQQQTAEEAELFKIITKAHEVLTDDVQRRAYDVHVHDEAFGGDASTAAQCNWLQHLRPAS